MKKISQIRHDAALQIQDEVAEALLAKAASDEKDADKMMKTLREMLEEAEGCSFGHIGSKRLV